MRVGVVGAGLAGIAAARTLVAGGHQATVFEQKPTPGGRVMTQALGPYVFDTGATSIAPRGQALERVILNEIATTDLVRIEKPVMAHDGFRAVSGSLMGSTTPRYCYRQGIYEVMRLLSEDLDVHSGFDVEAVEGDSNDGFSINGQGFDAVIVATPIPIVEKLLAKSREARKFSNVKFRSCLSVLLGFDKPFNAPFHALVGPDQAHPLAWLSFESLKCPERAPEGHTAIVAQASSEYSKRRFEADDDLILEETIGDVSRLLGKEFSTPVVTHVERFRYSHPEITTSFEAVNSPLSKLVIAGDGLLGGRTELAFETGIRAGRLLMEDA